MIGKVSLILLLLLAPAAWGQGVDSPDPMARGGVVYGLTPDEIVAEGLLRLYSEYADSCWADSIWVTSESSKVINWKIAEVGEWMPVKPTFEGFIEFLRRRYR